MRTSLSALRHLSCAVVAVTLIFIFPLSLRAQTAASSSATTGGSTTGNAPGTPTVLVLRPHCEKEKKEECPDFSIEDPVTLRTKVLHEGDTLDIDIVLKNPNGFALDAVRSWLSYDPQVLEGQSVELGKVFPLPVPGEAGFAAVQGFVQIGAAAAKGKEPRDLTIVVARVIFQVKHIPDGGKSAISFYDLNSSTNGHTVVVRDILGQKQNILPPKLGSLLVSMQKSTMGESSRTTSSAKTSSKATSSVTPATVSYSLSTSSSESSLMSASSSSSVSTTSSAVSSQPEAERTAFVLLQVQNIKIGTEGTSLFVTWDPLHASDLQGYNVYYGTVSGRYIQRKSVAATVSSLTLRALPLETTYYVAVRAVNQRNEESAFSQEVSITIGDPKSSTAPLNVGSTERGPGGKNPLTKGTTVTNEVPGETGPSSALALLLIFAAAIGTLCALWRQHIALRPHQ